MKRIFLLAALAAVAGVVAVTAPASRRADEEAAPTFVTQIPPSYRDWTLISVAHEEGNLHSLGAILGNDVAIKAYREGKLPFPDGTIIAALHFQHVPSEETTESSAVPSLSLPGPPRTFNLWSRTQQSTPRRAAGGSLTSKTANLATRRCSKPAFPATRRPKLATLSSPVTHLNTGTTCLHLSENVQRHIF